LHYGTLLGSRACVHMAAAAWGSGLLYAVLHTANTFSLPLCQGNAVDQFFCEIPQITKLSCSDSYLREVGLIVVTACFSVGCFVFIVLSYVPILRAVLRMPSEQGQHKAFSTCLPHMAVVSLFITTAVFAYLKPPSISSPSLDLVVSFLYSVVPPDGDEYHLHPPALDHRTHSTVVMLITFQVSWDNISGARVEEQQQLTFPVPDKPPTNAPLDQGQLTELLRSC
ncbi:olfactory receptor 14C36-like, partial [Gavia stellata]|uniref:olfactory receptor 14C36-like n=1 Tax=Gavia stellata TaxID=37040 RepID=UPI00289BB49B